MKQVIIKLPCHNEISVQEVLQNLDQELAAVDEVVFSGRACSKLFHIYTGVTDEQFFSSVAARLRERYPDAVIAGTLSAGEIAEGKLMDAGILVSAMLFETSEIKLFKFGHVKGNEEKTGEEICKTLDGIAHIKAAELLLTGTVFNTRMLFEQISKCREDIQIFGGYAGGHELAGGDFLIFDADGIYHNSVLIVTYAGEELHINMDKTAGWQTIGTPFTVTKADDNRLIEVNGRPAVELYEKYLQIGRDDNFAEETFEFPLMAKLNGEELLRHTMLVEEDGTLLLTGYVTEGMEIYLSYGNPSDITNKVNDRLKAIREFKPEAILLYSCTVRKVFWEDFVDVEMLPFNQYAPTAGFHTWGEVKRNPDTHNVLEYNITLLSIAFREGEAALGELSQAVVDDSVLKGQASLIKRLAKLVSASTGELMRAYEDISRMNKTLRIIAEHDGLTSLYNRSMIESMIDDELDRCRASGRKTTLVMLDIDHFKNVNDTYGHGVGDKVLKKIAELMKGISEDIPGAAVGRWGGEEFFIMLPDTNEEVAYQFAERLRTSVDREKFEAVGHITISLGVITVKELKDRKKIYTQVDDALYKAKETGRNRIVVAEG